MSEHHDIARLALNRRDFLLRAGSIGLGAMGTTLLLAGCGGGNSNNNNNNIDSTAYSGTLARANSQMRSVIQQYLALNPTPIYMLTPQQARLQPSVADAVRAVLQSQGKSFTAETVASTQDITIPGPAGPLESRMYVPSGTGSFPVLVYFHGGGWVIGTIDVYDSSCRALCNAAQCMVIIVEYRKGPENKFPAAHEDAYAATQYVLNNAGVWGGDPRQATSATSLPT